MQRAAGLTLDLQPPLPGLAPAGTDPRSGGRLRIGDRIRREVVGQAQHVVGFGVIHRFGGLVEGGRIRQRIEGTGFFGLRFVGDRGLGGFVRGGPFVCGRGGLVCGRGGLVCGRGGLVCGRGGRLGRFVGGRCGIGARGFLRPIAARPRDRRGSRPQRFLGGVGGVLCSGGDGHRQLGGRRHEGGTLRREARGQQPQDQQGHTEQPDQQPGPGDEHEQADGQALGGRLHRHRGGGTGRQGRRAGAGPGAADRRR